LKEKETDMSTDVEARLKRVEDLLTVQRLIVDYAVHLDNRDYTAYANLFAEDGEWANAEGGYKGRAAIHDMLKKIIGPVEGAPNPDNFHMPTNFQIDVNGDHATAFSRFFFVIHGPEGAPNDANFHIPSNMQVDVDGDRATAFSRFFFIIRGGDGAPVPALAGAYRDEFVRTTDGWRIKKRVAENIMPNSEEWAKIREDRMKARQGKS
jgi:ketosteroid isomerase-like protein